MFPAAVKLWPTQLNMHLYLTHPKVRACTDPTCSLWEMQLNPPVSVASMEQELEVASCLQLVILDDRCLRFQLGLTTVSRAETWSSRTSG